jgi:hypothetical protein
MVQVRAAATVILTLALCSLATARLRTGDVALSIGLQNVLDEVRDAERYFAETCGQGGYARSLAQLRIVRASFNEGFLADAFQERPTHLEGVVVRLESASGAPPGPLDCLNRQTALTYQASATYKWSWWKGPSFAMATDGVIWQSVTAEPPRPPFGAPAVPTVR